MKPYTHIPMLRVKIKSLAEESRIIRREEKRLPRYRCLLREHRLLEVRSESRHASLAYAFLRGREYIQVEAKCHQRPDWDRVRKLVAKFGAKFEWDGTEAGADFRARESKQEFELEQWIKRAATGKRAA